MTAMEALRRNVVYKRAKNKISQEQLAQRASVARQTVSKIESGNGNVTIDVVERIAKVLKCRVDELFDLQDTGTSSKELARRSKAPTGDFIDAFSLLDAIDEANQVRYSRAGRPKTVARKRSSGRR